MKFKTLIPVLCCIVAVFCLAGVSFAQTLPDNPPVDGQMVRLDAKRLWKMSCLPNLPMQNTEKIAENMRYPSISPDGRRVVMFVKHDDGRNALHEWKKDTREIRELIRHEDVSNFVTWDKSGLLNMRQRSNPFFRNAVQLRYDVEPHKLSLRDKKPITESTFTAYDEDDIIILESKKTKTLQAISDNRADRYYGPVVSPDERFVVFNGLTSGVHLFDIEANAVVYIGSNGTSPAFSPDGRYLIYAQTTDDGNEVTSGDFILVDLDKHSWRVISNPNHEIRLNATLGNHAGSIAYATSDGTSWIATLPLE